MNRLVGDPAIRLQKALDTAAEKHRVTAHNIANVNTPNYKRQQVVFADELQRASKNLPLMMTNPRHLAGKNSVGEPYRIVTDNSTTMRTDGNNVDIDREMAETAMNQLNYNALTHVLNQRYSLLRYIITEGRR